VNIRLGLHTFFQILVYEDNFSMNPYIVGSFFPALAARIMVNTTDPGQNLALWSFSEARILPIPALFWSFKNKNYQRKDRIHLVW
jgi:hypothetical protein